MPTTDPSPWSPVTHSLVPERKVSRISVEHSLLLSIMNVLVYIHQNVPLFSGPKCSGPSRSREHHERIRTLCSRRDVRYVQHVGGMFCSKYFIFYFHV